MHGTETLLVYSFTSVETLNFAMRKKVSVGSTFAQKFRRQSQKLRRRSWAGKKKDRDSLSKRSAAAADMADTESDERARTMKQTVMSGKPLLKIKADSSVSDYFDGTATPHSSVDSFFFRKMIEDIQAVGPG